MNPVPSQPGPAEAKSSAFEVWIGDDFGWQCVGTALLALVAQLALLAHKPVLIFEWRPTDLAAIALNYYRHGFDFLHPQILWGGNGPGYVEMEFPLVPYTIACLYALFGVHDWVALVILMLLGMGLAIVMNRFTRRFFGPAAGLIAGLFVATSPTWLAMSTGVWPDVPPIFCGACGLYMLTRWVEEDATVWFILAACSISLAILLKLTSLYLGLPAAFLFWVKYRCGWWRTPQAWVFAALVVVAPVTWYIHGYRLFLQYHNTFGIIASGYMKFGNARVLTSGSFYAKTFIRVIIFHTTPFGALLVAVGLVRRVSHVVAYLFHLWLAAVAMYFLVAAEGVNLGHYQYALPIVPPCAALAGRGIVILARRLEHRASAYAPSTGRLVSAVLVSLLAVSSTASNYVNERRGTVSGKLSLQKMKTGEALARLTPPGALIVVVDARMDDRTPETSMTPPEVFYFSDRRGWYRSMAWLTPATIEDLRLKGAAYLAVSANNVRWFRMQYTDLYNSCSRRYRTLMDSDDGIVYDLGAQP